MNQECRTKIVYSYRMKITGDCRRLPMFPILFMTFFRRLTKTRRFPMCFDYIPNTFQAQSTTTASYSTPWSWKEVFDCLNFLTVLAFKMILGHVTGVSLKRFQREIYNNHHLRFIVALSALYTCCDEQGVEKSGINKTLLTDCQSLVTFPTPSHLANIKRFSHLISDLHALLLLNWIENSSL